MSDKFGCLSCLLVGYEILGPVLNRLTNDHMYSCHNWEKLTQQVQTILSSKPTTFSGSFFTFSKSK